MAAPVRFGQIVWAEVADANGIRKVRPAVVVTPSDRLQGLGDSSRNFVNSSGL